jgi:hypothetical protein
MTIHRRRLSGIATAVTIAALWAAGAGTVSAQSSYYPPTPSQGPPPNLSFSSQQLTVDRFITRSVDATGMPNGVYDQIDQAVAANNASYGSGSSGALVTASKTRYSPWMYATQYTDRPNQNVALISYYIMYNISNIYGDGVSYPFSRTAGQSIDIQISCEGWYPWYKGNGMLTLTSIVSGVTLDTDHSVVEDTFGGILWNNVIPQYVDGQIASRLGRFPRGTKTTPLGISCNTLGVAAFPDDPQLDEVLWDYITPSPSIPPAVNPQISISVTEVRRLNNSAYYPVETPILELYAGYQLLVLNLPPMVANQSFFPDATAVVWSPVPPATTAYSAPLVLIANMRILDNIEDSTFDVFDATSNFGSGTQTAVTTKITSQFSLFYRKPIIVRSNGYEITLQIRPPLPSRPSRR